MNEIEKRVEEIVDNNALAIIDKNGGMVNKLALKKELTAYITKLLNEVVPKNLNCKTIFDDEYLDAYSECIGLIKQKIAKKLEEGK